jgi:hypothetical protein
MARAKTDSTVYRPDLGAAIMEFTEGPQLGYIGLEVMPVFKSAKEQATYPVIPKEALLKLHNTDRAPRAAYPRGDWEYERGRFTTSEQGWEEPLDDVERELFDQEAEGEADRVATARAWNIIMRGQEKRIADIIFNTTNFSANSVSNEWDKYSAASADPVGDVKDGIVAFKNQCGMMPDALVINFETYHDISRCLKVQDLLKYTFPGIDLNNLESPQLARLFGIPRVIVAGAVYDSAGMGQDASIADIWDHEYAILVKIASGQDITQPCVGRTFLWTEDSPSNPIVEQYREENRRSDIFRVRHYVGEQLIKSVTTDGTTAKSNISAACAYLLDNIHT